LANPTIAILGRPNVGKSTLFNRLIGKRHSIVSPVEGVTRDRVYGQMEWTGKNYNVIDTGGYLPETEDVIDKAVRIQSEIASDEADFLILLVDGNEDITTSDRYLVELILKSGKPFILVINKIDDSVHEISTLQFYELGLGEPVHISAISGRNVGDFLDRIIKKIPEKQSSPIEKEKELNLAIIGMPNVGKSSLMNALLKEEKSIVTEIAGTTRDSVDSYIQYYGNTYRVIDTAGLRRKAKVGDSIEFYSAVRTNRVIDECQVALVLLDAKKGFDRQDKDIVRHVIDSGRGMVLVVNKWDLIEKDSSTMKEYTEDIQLFFKSMEHYPIRYISVKENRRVWNVMETASQVFEEYSRKISTSKLNNFITEAVRRYPPPAVKGKFLKLKYATQVHHSPPIFAFFTNFPELFPISYKRYLENQLRKKFGFNGIPIKISFRKK